MRVVEMFFGRCQVARLALIAAALVAASSAGAQEGDSRALADRTSGASGAVLACGIQDAAESAAQREIRGFLGDSALRFELQKVEFSPGVMTLSLGTSLGGQRVEGGGITVIADPKTSRMRAMTHQLISSDDLVAEPALGADQAFSIAASQPGTPAWTRIEPAGLAYVVDLEGSIRLAWSGQVGWQDISGEHHARAFVDAVSGALLRVADERLEASRHAVPLKEGLFVPPQVSSISVERVDSCGKSIVSWYSVSNADHYEIRFTAGPNHTDFPVPAFVSSVPTQICHGVTVTENGSVKVRGCNVLGQCGPYSPSKGILGPTWQCGGGGAF